MQLADFEIVSWITSVSLAFKTTLLLELKFIFLKGMLKHMEQ